MFFAEFENAQSQVTLYRAVRDFVRKLFVRLADKGASQYA